MLLLLVPAITLAACAEPRDEPVPWATMGGSSPTLPGDSDDGSSNSASDDGDDDASTGSAETMDDSAGTAADGGSTGMLTAGGETTTGAAMYPAGPYGTNVGDVIASLSFVDQAGANVTFDDVFGSPQRAFVVYGTAAW